MYTKPSLWNKQSPELMRNTVLVERQKCEITAVVEREVGLVFLHLIMMKVSRLLT